MEVELRHLRVLSLLARAGSITRTAAGLGVSQPTLSAQLNRIERAFGGPLFERGPEGLKPTALGSHVLARARGILSEMEDLLATARVGPARSGIRLGTHPSILVGEWLRILECAPTGRVISATLNYSGAVLTQLLANNQVDVVFMGRVSDHLAPPLPPGTAERIITIETCGVALPVSHELAGRDQVHLAELAGETWIPPQGGDDGGTAMLRSACEAVGFTPQFRYHDIETSSLAGFVAAGLAVALASPTWQPVDGVTVVALANHPVDCHRVLRWRKFDVTDEEIDILHRTHHDLYRPVIERHIASLRWLALNPDARPRIFPADAA